MIKTVELVELVRGMVKKLDEKAKRYNELQDSKTACDFIQVVGAYNVLLLTLISDITRDEIFPYDVKEYIDKRDQGWWYE